MSDQETTSERRLAAIMVSDIAGYSSLMQSDEAGTFVTIGTMRGAAEKLVRQHRVRIANTAGDSILAEFSSAVEAVNCAIALQSVPPHQGLGRELQARIGMALREKPEGLLPLAISAVTNSLAGKSQEAQEAMARLRLANPNLPLRRQGRGPNIAT